MGNLWLTLLLSVLLAKAGCCCSWQAVEEPGNSSCCHAAPVSDPEPIPADPGISCHCHEVDGLLPSSQVQLKIPEGNAADSLSPWAGTGLAGSSAWGVPVSRRSFRERPPSSVALHVLHRSFRC